MNNSFQHAYIDQVDYRVSQKAKWYVYAENRWGEIRFVFLDTGLGIPKTIRKNFLERIGDYIVGKDSAYIASALRGEFRTTTGKEHRGKGLPEIYEHIGANHIGKMKIISGKGFCQIDKEKLIDAQDLQVEFKGTMFIWDIEKEEIV